VLSSAENALDSNFGNFLPQNIEMILFHDVFEEPIGQILIENQRVRLLIFDPESEEITKWIP
jgi:hypothetical protein